MCGGCGFRSMSIERQREVLQKSKTSKAIVSASRKKRDRHGNKKSNKIPNKKS